MKRVVSIGPDTAQHDYHITLTILGQSIDIQRIGTSGDFSQLAALLRTYDGQADVLALDGLAPVLHIGAAQRVDTTAVRVAEQAHRSPVVDGSGVRSILERWAVRRIYDQEPDLLRHRRALVLDGIGHYPLAQVLSEYTSSLQFADPIVQTGLASAPVLRSLRQLEQYATTILPLVSLYTRHLSPRRCANPGRHTRKRLRGLCRRADLLVGSADCLQAFTPDETRACLLVTDGLSSAHIENLAQRGTPTLITTMPRLQTEPPFVSAAVLEALMLVIQNSGKHLSPSSALRIISAAGWEPAIYHLNPPPHRPVFAFVIHPMSVQHIARKPSLGFTRYLPPFLVERATAHTPPLRLSYIRGIRSEATHQESMGILIALGTTPHEMLRRPPEFTYRRLVQAARMAEQMGARIMGLGAFTSVVGDAGVSVARRTPIGITSGNALTVAVTLESVRLALRLMGGELAQTKVAVIGASGSIGAACARLLAAQARQIVLVAPRPERLLTLQRQIEQETPTASVVATLRPDEAISDADVIVTATTALNNRVLRLQTLKPGAIVCDVARPLNVSQADAEQRPDVLVIESGDIHLPGNPQFGFEIDLPPGMAYACLAETALLAMEGIFDDYTVGRTISIERVKEIRSLMEKHGCKLANLRSFGREVTPEDIARKRQLVASHTP